jgi:hypothetical protein
MNEQKHTLHVFSFYILNLNIFPNYGKAPIQSTVSDPGFTHVTEHGLVKRQSVVCCETLSNKSVKESKLKRRFETKHNAFVGKRYIFF